MQPRTFVFNQLVGILSILVWAIFVSSKEVMVGHYIQKVPPLQMMVYCLTPASLFFGGMILWQHRRMQLQLKENIKTVLGLNITTLIAFYGSFMTVKYLEPAVGITISTSLSPVILLLLSPWLRPDGHILGIEKVGALSILAALLFLGWATLGGHSGVGEVSFYETFLGTFWACLTSFMVVVIQLLSKTLYEKSWSISELIAMRFPLIFLLTAGYVVLSGADFMEAEIEWYWILLISLVGFIIPIFSVQLGLKNMEPIEVSLLMTILPLATFFWQIFDDRLEWSNFSLAGILFVFATLVATNLVRLQKGGA